MLASEQPIPTCALRKPSALFPSAGQLPLANKEEVNERPWRFPGICGPGYYLQKSCLSGKLLQRGIPSWVFIKDDKPPSRGTESQRSLRGMKARSQVRFHGSIGLLPFHFSFVLGIQNEEQARDRGPINTGFNKTESEYAVFQQHPSEGATFVPNHRECVLFSPVLCSVPTLPKCLVERNPLWPGSEKFLSLRTLQRKSPLLPALVRVSLESWELSKVQFSHCFFMVLGLIFFLY